jgi:hypothetical protein
VQLQPILFIGLVKRGKSRGDPKTQVPTRWIDQGAIEAVSIVEVPNRYLAGVTEVALRIIMLINNWRKMLTNSIEHVDLLAERLKLENLIPSEVQEYFF